MQRPPFKERLHFLLADIDTRVARQRVREKNMLHGARYGMRKEFAVTPDLVDIEARVLAVMAGKGNRFAQLTLAMAAANWFDLKVDGESMAHVDLHTVRATELFGVKYDQVTPEQRKVAKMRNFWEMYQ